MIVYYFMILVLMGLGYILTEKKKDTKLTIGYLGIAFLFFTFFASFRYAIGFDYFSYRKLYKMAAGLTFGDILSFYWNESFFFLICKCFSLFGCSYTVFLVGINLFLFFVAMRFIYYESKSPWISVFLYITLQFFAYNMNLVRQSISVAFFLIAYPYLKDRKIMLYSIFIVIGGFFHNSLFLFYPFYFLLPKKITWRFWGSIIGITLMAYFLCDPVIEFLLPFFPEKYADYLNSYFWSANGFEYVLPSVFYMVFVFLFGRQITDIKKKRIYFNSALYQFLISLFITKHFILERFSIYPFVLSLVAIPEVVNSYQKEKEQKKEKKVIFDYHFVLGTAIVLGWAYFFFAAVKGFHHVYPYVSLLKRGYSLPN